MHWAENCTFSTAEEKKGFKDKIAAIEAWVGPARPNRNQASSTNAGVDLSSKSIPCIRHDNDDNSSNENDAPSCIMTVLDSKASLDVIGRYNDDSDEYSASTTLNERAVIQTIGNIEKNDTISLQIALTKKDEKPNQKNFSRAWNVPSTALHLISGRMALKIF